MFYVFLFQVSSRSSVEMMSVELSQRWLQESHSTRCYVLVVKTIIKLSHSRKIKIKTLFCKRLVYCI